MTVNAPSTTAHQSLPLVVMPTEERCYLGNDVLLCEDVKEEARSGLSLAVCDWTVTVHHQVLLNPRSQVLLPARLQHKEKHIRTTSEPASLQVWESF